MMSDGSSAPVSTTLNWSFAFCSRSSQGSTPASRAPPTPITCLSWLSLPLIAQRFGSVLEAVLERFRTEEVRQRQRDRADLEDRDVGDGGLGTLRQQQRDAIAALHAQGLQRVAQAVGGFLDVVEGEARAGARLVLPQQREARALRGPLAAAVAADVEALRNLPAEAAADLLVAVQHAGILYLGMFKALVFDAYGTLFDVHSVARRCEALWPGKGAALSAAWRARQLEYTWLRSLMGRYVPFSQVTRDALAWACESLGLPFTDDKLSTLLDEYRRLALFPEVKEAFQNIKGVKRAILSNGSPDMLDPLVAQSGLQFDAVLSVDEVKAYKPTPAVYELAVRKLKTAKSEIGFVSSNCWD